MEGKNEIVTKNEGTPVAKQSFSTILTNSLMGVKEALPDGFNIPRFVQNAISLLNNNKPLAEYAKKHGTERIKQGLMLGAFLDLDAMNGECHLIPYGSDLNFQKDYKGVQKLIKEHSINPVDDVYAKIVREGDFFEEIVSMGKRSVNFKPIPFNNGKIVGAFAVVVYKDGSIAYDVMSIDELNVTKAHAKGSNSMAWKDFPWEMYKKTVIHRLSKQVPLSFKNKEQKDAFMADMEIETDTEKIVEAEIAENANSVEFTEIIDEPKATEKEFVSVQGEQPFPDFMLGE